MRCSRGTYIRALAADIGDALGCGAHLSKLVRTKSGIFELKDSIRLEEIQAGTQNVCRFLRSMDDVLAFMPKIVITSSARKRFLNGAPVSGSGMVDYEGEFWVDDLIRVHDEAEGLLGIGRATAATRDTAAALSTQAVICKTVKVLRKT